MTSIRDVAKLAGVSPSTVSRVMNGTANVETMKRQKVLAAIEETGFRPNELARSLYKKSSKIIGVILPTMENLFFNEMAKYIEEEAYKNGYRFALCNSNNDHKKELANIRIMSQLNADGMILMTNHEKIWHEVHKCNIPVVIMDRQLDDHKELGYIQSDHYKGGRIATEHLTDCGCKFIVNMRGSQLLSSGRQRFQGYLDVCSERGIPVHYVDCSFDYKDGVEATKYIIEHYPQVDGIMASNDMVALAVYKELKKHGYEVPKDVQLIGYDNIDLSWMMEPGITTISQQTKEMGTMATSMIMNHAKHISFEKEFTYDVSLIQRDTTKKISNSEEN